MESATEEQIQEVKRQHQNARDIDSIENPYEKLIKLGRSIEEIIQVHFPVEVKEGYKPTLGYLLIESKKSYPWRLRKSIKKVIDDRNDVIHYLEGGGIPPEKNFVRSVNGVLEHVLNVHVDQLIKKHGLDKDKLDDDNGNGSAGGDHPPVDIVFDPKSQPVPPASETDPHLSASTLAEFTFCPRAGVLTHEGGFTESGEELPSTGRLPWFEQDAIEKVYSQSITRLAAMLIGFLAVQILAAASPLVRTSIYPLVVGVFSVVWLYGFVLAFSRWREIGHRRLAFNMAVKCDPNPNRQEPQSVDWWGLLKAGYEVDRPTTSTVDNRAKLSGKPRRTIQKGDLTIPVHRVQSKSGKVKPQHIVRVMAYCHLVDEVQGANSPFAIILFGDTYRGITVPVTPENWTTFCDTVKQVRSLLLKSDAGEWSPPKPPHQSICAACFHGMPRAEGSDQPTFRYDKPLEPVILVPKSGKNRALHCSCGDRYDWKPKHWQNAKLKRLE